jgi:hypothetical protein
MANQFGYCCPKCGSDAEIQVYTNILVIGTLTEEGYDYEKTNSDTEFEDEDVAVCGVCNWEGTVGGLVVDKSKARDVMDEPNWDKEEGE